MSVLRRLRRAKPKPGPPELATRSQIEFILGLCAEIGRDPPDDIEMLTKAEAEKLRSALVIERGGGGPSDASTVSPASGADSKSPGPR